MISKKYQIGDKVIVDIYRHTYSGQYYVVRTSSMYKYDYKKYCEVKGQIIGLPYKDPDGYAVHDYIVFIPEMINIKTGNKLSKSVKINNKQHILIDDFKHHQVPLEFKNKKGIYISAKYIKPWNKIIPKCMWCFGVFKENIYDR